MAEAPKARAPSAQGARMEVGFLGRGCPPPQPTNGSSGASWAPPAGSGAELRPPKHLLWDELIKSVLMSVRSAVHSEAQCRSQLVILRKVDKTFSFVWLWRSSQIRVKVTEPSELQKQLFYNYVFAIYVASSDLTIIVCALEDNISILLGRIFDIFPTSYVTEFDRK